MKTQELIEKHQKAIEVLEGIQHFESCVNLYKESLAGMAGMFPELVNKYHDKIDHYQRCIGRLESRYQKLKDSM